MRYDKGRRVTVQPWRQPTEGKKQIFQADTTLCAFTGIDSAQPASARTQQAFSFGFAGNDAPAADVQPEEEEPEEAEEAPAASSAPEVMRLPEPPQPAPQHSQVPLPSAGPVCESGL